MRPCQCLATPRQSGPRRSTLNTCTDILSPRKKKSWGKQYSGRSVERSVESGLEARCLTRLTVGIKLTKSHAKVNGLTPVSQAYRPFQAKPLHVSSASESRTVYFYLFFNGFSISSLTEPPTGTLRGLYRTAETRLSISFFTRASNSPNSTRMYVAGPCTLPISKSSPSRTFSISISRDLRCPTPRISSRVFRVRQRRSWWSRLIFYFSLIFYLLASILLYTRS